MKNFLLVASVASLLSACATPKQISCASQSPEKNVVPATESVTGPSRNEILQMLPHRKWYWFWESQDRNLPSTFIVTDEGQILRKMPGKPVQRWKLEQRWVLNEGDHLLIPMNNDMLRGFYIPSGRQVGMFSDPTH